MAVKSDKTSIGLDSNKQFVKTSIVKTVVFSFTFGLGLALPLAAK